MLKRIGLGVLTALAVLTAGAQTAAAGPGNCDCEWVTVRNGDGDIVGGFWVCPDPSICQIVVEP
jgi:hypothetical protein